MQLFVWTTDATTGYFNGIIAVCAEDVKRARIKIKADLNRWLRTGFEEGSPTAHDFSETGELLDPFWKEETYKQLEDIRAEVLVDIAKEPMTPGVYWRGGGD